MMVLLMRLNLKCPKQLSQLKVTIPFHELECVSDSFIVDIEPEDIDLGNTRQADLAFDVDGDLADEDPEALDSGDERRIDEELGIDADVCESACSRFNEAPDISLNVPNSANACHSFILFASQ